MTDITKGSTVTITAPEDHHISNHNGETATVVEEPSGENVMVEFDSETEYWGERTLVPVDCVTMKE